MFDGKTIHTLHFTIIDSTNSWAKEHAHELDHNALTCITADQQTAGRGQREKSWFSPPLGNLYMTLFFVFPTNFSWSANLGQVLALSSARVLQELGFAPALKWPNDILLEEKKAGGVLCETLNLSDGLGVVLGMGLNVHIAKEHLADLDQPATSLSAHSGKPLSLSSLAQALVRKFLIYLHKLQQGGFATFAKEYNQLLAYKNQEVLFFHPEGVFSAICQKIDEQGRIVLECADGKERHFCSGSLRKIRPS
jgi:BirA family transcriptional regulator, biotin operon repressor / biotin---[acetyl-CoA-carboxylase] ligase